MDTRSSNTLHAAIKAQNIEHINTYLASLSDLELRKVLQERVDGLTAIELAFGINKEMSLNIAKSVLSTEQKLKITRVESDRSHPIFPLWSQIFMTFKHYFMTLKNGRRISSKELATKMAFAKPFIHELNLLDVMDREGFIRTALLLGAPCDPQRLCSKIILANMDLSKAQKEKLVDWLLVNDFLNKEIEPLPLADYGRWMRKGYYEHVHVFMSRFPNWINTSDRAYSILTHHALKMEVLLRYMEDIKKQFGVRKLIELLTQKVSNIGNHRENITCYNFHAQFINNGIRWPTEMVTAMIESHDNSLQVYEIQLHHFKSVDMVLYHMFPQYREKLELRVNGKQHALTIELSENSNKGNRLGSASDYFPIDQFPSDLIYVIGGLLKPMDLLSVFTVNKRMASFLRQSKNEIFWQGYFDTHFQRDFGPKVISYKTKTICNAKSLYNWTRNQSFQLELDQTTPVEMDENWLLLTNDSDNKHSVLWSCHTHQQFNIKKEAIEIPVAFMKDNNAETLPAVISWNKTESSYCLQRNDEHFVFKSLVGRKKDNVIPAGNRLLLDGLVCDVEMDRMLSGPNPPKNIGFFPTYNPYSNTFILAGGSTVELCDMDGNLVQTFNIQGHYFSALHKAVMANEHEICFVDGPLRFDLRTGRMLPRVWYRHATLSTVAASPHRVLYRDQQLDIVVSWHLPSSRWEFAAQMEPVPQCVNSRYIAAKHHNRTVIYDFCS